MATNCKLAMENIIKLIKFQESNIVAAYIRIITFEQRCFHGILFYPKSPRAKIIVNEYLD